jgi:1-acyl-sn-glycerol-3-phosphate acyltransferase
MHADEIHRDCHRHCSGWSDMINRIIALFFLAFMGITSAVFFIIAVVIRVCTAAFDKRLVWLHMFTSFWACLYLWAMPAWSLRAAGREKIRKDATYVVVSNHQSGLDILVAFRLFFPFKWVSKAEMFRVPFIGWNMYLNGYIKLNRREKESRRNTLSACEKVLNRGSSVYFFPEGTRSETGRLKPFKPGAFILAHQMRLPILAIAINGTRRALPKASLNFHGRHLIRIEVIGEIPYADFAALSVEETAEMVRGRIAAHVEAN